MRDVSTTGRKRSKETQNGKKTLKGDREGARPLKPVKVRPNSPAVSLGAKTTSNRAFTWHEQKTYQTPKAEQILRKPQQSQPQLFDSPA